MSGSRKGKTIEKKILRSYLLLLIIPLCLITVFNYTQSAGTIQKKSVEQFYTVTEVINNQFDQYFRDVENLSINVLQEPRIQTVLRQPFIPSNAWTTKQIEDDTRVSNFLYGIYKLKPGISSILVYGFNDMNYFYHPTRRWNISYDGRQEEWYQKTIEADGSWILSGRRTELQLFSTLDMEKETVVTISRVIKDLDTFKPLGVLYINIKLDMLDTLSTWNERPNRLDITDQSGDPVIEKGDWLGTEPDNWIKVTTVSDFTQWKVNYYASKEELFSETKRIRNLLFAITLFLILLAFIVARGISSGIAMPLNNLKLKMRDVGTGEFEHGVILTDTDEIEELANGFNYMVLRIKKLVEEIQQKEEQRLQIELGALQARINPHFMYNTLNGMRWIAMMEGNQKLSELIASFIYLLKFSAKNKESLITIENEISLLNAYVDLMKMRYEQFDFVIDAETGMYQYLIIPFLLQPIVENAIFHGVVPASRKGEILVKIYRENGKIITIVQDNGIGMDDTTRQRLLFSDNTEEEHYSKIGIKNVYDRLKLQFGAEADLSVESVQGEGTRISIHWPAILKEGDHID